jgi:hypothetical protein
MSRFVLAIIVTGFLSACDGTHAPTRQAPETKSTGTGIKVSGSARFGVVHGPKGTVDRF